MAKLEEKELQELKQSLSKPNQIALEIGMRVIAHSQIDKLVEEWEKSKEEEQSKMKELEEKHGKGQIDINTGEITPLNED